MLILGVDPGTIITGYGIVDFNGNQFSLVKSGIISPSSKLRLSERLKNIYDSLDEIIKVYRPDEFSLETAFYGKNIQSTLKIGYVRGIALLAAEKNGLIPGEYSPREIKKAVAGRGAATKQQVMFMVMKLVNLKKEKIKFDETDAIAAAVCHAFRAGKPTPKNGNWKKFIEDNPERIVR